MFNVKIEKQEIHVTQKNEAKKEMQTNFNGTIRSFAFIKDPAAVTAHPQGHNTMAVSSVIDKAHAANPGGVLYTLFGTSEGQIYIMNKNFELRGPLESSPYKDMEILCMSQVVNSKGFIIGGNCRKMLQYEEQGKDVKNPFTKVERSIQNKAYDGISINALCQPNEDYLIAGLKDGRLIKIKLNTERSGATEGFEFSNLVYSFHYNRIYDMDVAVMKPLIVTCSADKTVKIWNYETKSLELEHTFNEEVKMVAFHPSGFHLAVALPSRIKLLNILLEGLEEYHEIVEKACTALSYSSGGQYFSVAKNSTVHVYSSYTGDLMANLSLKDEGNPIKSIMWNINDFKVYTLASDSQGGNIIEWSYDLDRSDRLVVNKTSIINSPSLGSSMDFTMANSKESENSLIATTVEKKIFSIKLKKDDIKAQERDNLLDAKKLLEYQPVARPTGAKINYIKFNHNQSLLMMGTAGSGRDPNDQPGILRAYKYPLTGQVTEIKVHSADITKICVSRSENMVFTISEDNTIAIIRLKSERDQSTLIRLPFGNDCLYREDRYMDTVRDIVESQQQQKAQSEYTKRLQEEQLYRQQREKMEFEKLKEDATRKGNSAVDRINAEKKKIEERYQAENERHKEEHKARLFELERLNEKKIEEEAAKLEQKIKEKEELEIKHNEDKRKLEELFLQQKAELREKYKRELDEEKQYTNHLNEILKEENNRHKALIYEEELDADNKMDKLRRSNDIEYTKLDTEYQKQNTLLDKAISDCQEKESLNMKTNEELNNANKIYREIMSVIASEKNRKAGLENDIQEREETIRKKNDRIKELERKSQELEKFKFVLKYKIGELRREIGPREQEISIMKQQLEVMQAETKEFKKTNEHLRLFVNEFGLQLVSIRNEIKSQEVIIEENKRYINAYECEISELCKIIQKNGSEKVGPVQQGCQEEAH